MVEGIQQKEKFAEASLCQSAGPTADSNAEPCTDLCKHTNFTGCFVRGTCCRSGQEAEMLPT